MGEELSIRIGLSLAGVQQTKKQADDLQTRVRTTKKEADVVDQAVKRIEGKLRNIGKDALKQGTRFALAEGLHSGLEGLLPIQEQGAWAALGAKFGSRVGTGLLFAGPAGAITGGLLFAIEQTKEIVQGLVEEVKSTRKTFDEYRTAADKSIADLQAQQRKLLDDREEDIKKIERKLYLELRAG